MVSFLTFQMVKRKSITSNSQTHKSIQVLPQQACVHSTAYRRWLSSWLECSKLLHGPILTSVFPVFFSCMILMTFQQTTGNQSHTPTELCIGSCYAGAWWNTFQGPNKFFLVQTASILSWTADIQVISYTVYLRVLQSSEQCISHLIGLHDISQVYL